MTLQDLPFPGQGNGNCNGRGNLLDCETATPIDDYVIWVALAILFICLAVIAYNWLKDKPKFKQFKQFLTDLSKGCPNETKY